MSPRRTNIDILQAIKQFILESGTKEFHKSAIRDSGGDVAPNTVERICRLVEYCQTEMPAMRVRKVGSSVIIQVLEERNDE
jgi:hypothetical protein